MRKSTFLHSKPSVMPRTKITDPAICEQLIELVREYPILYDAQAPDRKNIDAVKSAWQRIAETLGLEQSSWEAVRTRWRTFRDMYVKKKKEMAEQRNKNYTYATGKYMGLLDFLAPYIDDFRSVKSENRQDSFYDDSFNIIQHADSDDRVEEEDVKTNALVANASETSASPTCTSNTASVTNAETSNILPNPKRFKASKQSKYGSSVFEPPKEKGNVHLHRHAMDAFFESCAIRARRLSYEKQGWLQMQVSTLMYQAETSIIVHETDNTVQNSVVTS